MPYFLKGNCVWKGTEENPEEEVKCHEDKAAATAHIRALYANAEDADEKALWDAEIAKGGPGSGWHNPPEGTHDAEHAPNFAGGPGADREYGTESDEPPDKTKRCKCSKCGAVVILPKGKQCEDIKCPSCGGGATQEEPREDKPAEGEGGRNPKPGREKAAQQETHGCTCPECGKSVQVPLGQKCNEVKCPECKAMMKQESSGEDGKAMGAPGPTIHGEGGSLGEVSSVLGEEGKCKCPKCGKAIPCTAKACPYCKESLDRVERTDTEAKRVTKKEGDGEHPAAHYLVVEKPENPSTWHLRVRNAQGDLDHTLMGAAWAALHKGYRGNTYAGPNKEMALAKLKRLYKQEGMDTPGEEKAFVSYKMADGTWRWMTLSNWAVVDKEKEVVSKQSYLDAIAYAEKSSHWGELDLVHVDGTDVGDADMLFVVNCDDGTAKFGGGGTWYDTEKATRARKAIQADPEAWGVSIKFRFNPQRKVRGVYTGDIQVLKHSILPQEMAASYGTAIAVQGGEPMSKQIDDKTVEALAKLGHTPEEIEALAEKNKALPPEEENVVEKEETNVAVEPVERETLWKKLGEALGIGTKAVPVASEPEEARKTEEVAPTETIEPEQPATEEKAEETPETPDPSVLLQALGEAMSKSIGEMVKAELDARDERITALEEQIKGLSDSVEEKVEQRLRDLPKAVTVAASQVNATAVDEQPPKGLVFGQKSATPEFLPELMKGIQQVVKDTAEGAGFKV